MHLVCVPNNQRGVEVETFFNPAVVLIRNTAFPNLEPWLVHEPKAIPLTPRLVKVASYYDTHDTVVATIPPSDPF